MPLLDDSVRNQMHAYQASILRTLNCPAIVVDGTDNHVHIFCLLSRTENISNILLKIKRSSSKWIKTKGDKYHKFQWQKGYGVFSVSHSNLAKVKDYILNQQAHHKSISFEDELRSFFKKHNVEFDEKYVWD